MNYLIIAVKDTAVDAFQSAVHLARARGEALRNFSDAVNDPNNRQLNKHPQDFELWILATFDDQTGTITPQQERLTRAIDVHREPK